MIRIEGKAGISATILADSISPEGVRLTTFELIYPRIILAELNTHRALSRASASSRAIPFDKMVKTLTGRPVRFGQANPGMQDKGEEFRGSIRDNGGAFYEAVEAWDEARRQAVKWSERFYEGGFHKQIYNRLTEPFQMMKTVMTATEWNNFFWLRDDGAADPTLAELARVMREARDASTPMLLQPGEWALPYVFTVRSEANGGLFYYDDIPKWDDNINPYDFYNGLTLEQAKKVSAARCAAVSFRNIDYTLEKSEEVFARLVGDERKHASAFEHQATPMESEGAGDWEVNVATRLETWEQGVSHMDRNGNLWSGNLKGFIQFRKTIDGENKEG